MSKQDYIQLRTLTDQFYADNKGLQEALDGSNDGKVRGYGIVVIDLNGLVFGIPLRSHLNHKFDSFRSDQKVLRKDWITPKRC